MSNGSASLRLISGVGAKGPACFLLEVGSKRLMLDLGEGPPPGSLPNVDDVGRLDALILSHGHKDHVGGLSLLAKLGNPPVYATDIVARALPHGVAVRPLPVGGRADVLGIEVETGRNGHAPGGIWLRFAIGDGFLYTGDWSTESILYAYDPPPPPYPPPLAGEGKSMNPPPLAGEGKSMNPPPLAGEGRVGAATALVDCSYANYEKPIAECWKSLAPFVTRGPLLLPVPANGRGPEIALELARRGLGEIFVDETMQKALQRLCESDSISLRAGVGREIKRLADAAKPIERAEGVMLAASADGTSGATARLLAQWEPVSEPAIVFTGYVPPGTPAERLIKSGRAQFTRWNVHPRLSDIVALVRAVRAKTVIAAFCDRSQLAALADALAPARVTMDGPVGI